jgi:hypothetical protein
VTRGILDTFPKELIRLQFTQLVERIANVPQSIEPLSIGGIRCQLRFYNAQLAFQHIVFLPGLLDLWLKVRQFLC